MKSLIIIFQSRDCFLAPAPHLFNAVQTVLPSVVVASGLRLVELQTKVREDFTITKKAPANYLFKVVTTAFSPEP